MVHRGRMKDFVEPVTIETTGLRRGRLFDLLRLSEDGEPADTAPRVHAEFELSDYELASIQAHALQSLSRPRV